MPYTQKQTELLSRFDQDPGRFRPMYYSLVVSVPLTVNGEGTGSIPIYNQPFILKQITHEIIGPVADPSATAFGVYQDGQYTIEFKDEQSTYLDRRASANALFGNVHQGPVIPLPFVLPYAGNKTLTFIVRNLIARALGQEDHFDVQIVLHGVADWGQLEGGR